MALVSAEWRIPLGLVYDGWFVPPLGIGRHALALFVDSGDACFDNESADFKTGAGLEWNVEGLLGYNLLPLGMKVGYAHGFYEGGKDRVYFQLGLSFL
jgi:outer membrane translocation and assembly module TamA